MHVLLCYLLVLLELGLPRVVLGLLGATLDNLMLETLHSRSIKRITFEMSDRTLKENDI